MGKPKHDLMAAGKTPRLDLQSAPHETDGGRKESKNYIFLWEESGEIVACILPDVENIYFSIQKGFEELFPSRLQREALPPSVPAG